MNYYNEIEPYCAEWLRNLIKDGLLPAGEVDERDIRDVTPKELVGFTQCHFFAGLGGWSYALRLAGWPDDRPVWTGSCPCQSFSTAGQGAGFADERHLWPYWFHLIRICRPPIIFGEQVASKLALSWLDLVSADLEAEGYSIGAADLPASSVGAPHIRQRLWFVAYASSTRSRHHNRQAPNKGRETLQLRGEGIRQGNREIMPDGVDSTNPTGFMADLQGAGQLREEQPQDNREGLSGRSTDDLGKDGERKSFWHSCEWLPCRDGKWRATQPGLLPLAHGVPKRVPKLRAIGNAIVPQVAAEFIRAWDWIWRKR